MSEPVTFLDGRVRLYAGNCLDALAEMEPDSVDSCVTDPPYHLTSIVRRFGKTSLDGEGTNEDRARRRTDGMARLSSGFMGQKWDGGDIAFDPATWAAVMRVLKPGAHLVAFGAPKNVHRLACAIEDAGFEVRDCLQWLFGSGFPKSHNIGEGWGTALKPAYEPIILARKPLSEKTVAANVLRWGTGALNIDGCRVGDSGARNNGRKVDSDIYGKMGPIDLMRWLVRLVTPPGGTILDPFAGTGTTGEAAFYEGFNAVLCEREAEYIADIERRMKLCLAGPDERAREIVKAKGKPDLTGTLFEAIDV